MPYQHLLHFKHFYFLVFIQKKCISAWNQSWWCGQNLWILSWELCQTTWNTDVWKQHAVTLQSIPCTVNTTGSLNRSPPRRSIAHTTTVLLYSFVAGTCKNTVLPVPVVLISCVFNSVDPLTIQTIMPALALQLKVAVDPNVALIDVGVLTKAGIENNENTIKLASDSLIVSWDRIIYLYKALFQHIGWLYITARPTLLQKDAVNGLFINTTNFYYHTNCEILVFTQYYLQATAPLSISNSVTIAAVMWCFIV